jgi:hypothetical protein
MICSKCGEDKETGDFYAGRRACKECDKRRVGEWQKAHRDGAYMRLWRYGISEEDFHALLTEQDGRGAICRQVMTKPHIDHSHKTGEIRGLLCFHCNAGLGHFKDSPALMRRALAYSQGRYYRTKMQKCGTPEQENHKRVAALESRTTTAA